MLRSVNLDKLKKKSFLFIALLFVILFASTANAITDTNLINYYKFDEASGVLVDWVGYDNNGTNTNITYSTTGIINTAYTYGATSKTVLANTTNLSGIENTLAFWINPSNAGTQRDIFYWAQALNESRAYVDNTNTLKWNVYTAGSYVAQLSCGTINAGTWYFITLTAKNNEFICYVNGSQRAIDTSGNTPTTTYTSATIGLNALPNYYTGIIDEWSIWDKVLTTDINALYNDGNGLAYPFTSPSIITADFNTDFNVTSNTLSLISNSSIDVNYTIVDWNWTIDGSTSNIVNPDANETTFTPVTQNLDYNICLAVGGQQDSNTANKIYDTACQSLVAWDTIAPTIDVNININQGFVTNYDVNYSMQCFDNGTPITYWIIKNDTNTLYLSDDANASIKTGTLTLTPTSTTHLEFICIDSEANQATYTTDDFYLLTFRLLNEETGVPLVAADFNSTSRMFIKKIVAFDIDGNYSYDFNATSTTQKNFLGYTTNLWFEITYNNAGTDTKIDRKIDFSLIPDTNIGICIPPLQEFYEQKFYSVSAYKEVYLYQPNAKCYVLAGGTDYIGGLTGNEITTWTINRPYQSYLIVNGIKTFLALINGAVANQYNLDAIAFNQQAVQISIGADTLAFTPGIADSNTINIYFNSFKQDYTTTTLSIYNADTLLYTLTEDTNANEFLLVWLYSPYGLTDQNMLKIVVVGTNADGDTTLTEYFNILGDEFLGDKDPSFIAIIAILFFLFGITMMSIGKTFGWFGMIVCIVSMAITLMAVQTYWLIMIEGGLFICFLFILLSGGLVQSVARGFQ
jgi:hypothetical protein